MALTFSNWERDTADPSQVIVRFNRLGKDTTLLRLVADRIGSRMLEGTDPKDEALWQKYLEAVRDTGALRAQLLVQFFSAQAYFLRWPQGRDFVKVDNRTPTNWLLPVLRGKSPRYELPPCAVSDFLWLEWGGATTWPKALEGSVSGATGWVFVSPMDPHFLVCGWAYDYLSVSYRPSVKGNDWREVVHMSTRGKLCESSWLCMALEHFERWPFNLPVLRVWDRNTTKYGSMQLRSTYNTKRLLPSGASGESNTYSPKAWVTLTSGTEVVRHMTEVVRWVRWLAGDLATPWPDWVPCPEFASKEERRKTEIRWLKAHRLV